MQIFCKKITDAVTIEIEETDVFEVANSQEKLFRTWFEKYKNLIFKVVNTYTSSPEDQDDLFQEILLQLWYSIPGFHGEAKETTWIYRVALNTALVWKRSETRKKKRFRTEILDIQEIAHSKDNCDELSQSKQVLEQLYDSIRQCKGRSKIAAGGGAE